MSILNKEQILSAQDRQTVEVKVPEWGGSVIVASMSGSDRDEFEASLISNKHANNHRAHLLSYALVDEQNNRLFTTEDVEALGKKSIAALERLVRVAQRLNKLTDKELEDTKSSS